MTSNLDADRRRENAARLRESVRPKAAKGTFDERGRFTSAVIHVEGEPEISDLATAILMARIEASKLTMKSHNGIEHLKKAALADARLAWPFLEKRGWRALDAGFADEGA